MEAPSNTFRNVRLSTLRLAVAAAGFSPATNTLDKIIDDNATFHKHSLDGTKMAMSVPVVDRIKELTSQPAGNETATVDPETATIVSQTSPIVSETPSIDSQLPALPPDVQLADSDPTADPLL